MYVIWVQRPYDHLRFERNMEELPFDMFSGLTKLETLVLADVNILGLDALLNKLSSLHTLDLALFHIPVLQGVSWASNSLRHLKLDNVSPLFPELSLSALPALQSIEVDRFSVGGGVGGEELEGYSDADKLEKIETMAKWLSLLPLRTAGNRYIVTQPLTVVGRTDWSAVFCQSCFEMLAPLQQLFMSVDQVHLMSWNIGDISAVCRLFGTQVRVLELNLGCRFSEEQTERALLDSVQLFPNLVKLTLLVSQFDELPVDAVAALLAAQQEGRQLLLSLATKEGSAITARLLDLTGVWQAVKLVRPGPQDLKVRRLLSYDDEI